MNKKVRELLYNSQRVYIPLGKPGVVKDMAGNPITYESFTGKQWKAHSYTTYTGKKKKKLKK